MKTITKLFQHRVRPAAIFAAGARNTACALFAAALLLASCGKDDPESKPTLTISPAAETLDFSAADAKSYTFTVITDQPAWKAVSDQTWCQVETNAEAGTFTVTAQQNNETAAPSPATITVTAGNAVPLTITATQAGARYEIYALGFTLGKDACYWKNGELFPLEGPDKTQCYAICIDNNSVYFGGSYGNNSGYWKDGEITLFEQPNGLTRSQCSAIAVSDGRVLGVGTTEGENFDYFCYWDDGTLSESFANLNVDSYGQDIAVCDGSVYLLGYFKDGNKSTLWYKKRGMQDLVVLEPPSGYITAEGRAIVVSEGRVYVAGFCENESYDRVAGYWLDGVFMPLVDPASGSDSWADAIVVENGTVHIAGSHEVGDTRSAFYWNKEHGLTLLSQPEGAEEAGEMRGLEVCGGKVFISGSYLLDNVLKPCYWIEDERVDLPAPNGEQTLCISLAVMIK